ncbi:lasso RiPP family leader peptide-containing protein [Paraglaciecola arctica]|uniref:lasso RiPP family leader peptide-containing protein n=1 Tax=Paraglaciecola arctica TaxID=1128911 RepID=UPI001C07DC25|nr:lasso RiPP family leader peptide-containing protein [Paraglaciecola arctica]MBU3004326.1 lasso RiPP family leader peptide-containing protein [Paraglaciecola arctica]|tara:strand:- start:16552 stop:16707 length:156 start_codon:yes stop_codon:yes gene_type:complete
MTDSTINSSEKREYVKPELTKVGSLAELTQGFSGSVPDENGGHTKRNPFQG